MIACAHSMWDVFISHGWLGQDLDTCFQGSSFSLQTQLPDKKGLIHLISSIPFRHLGFEWRTLDLGSKVRDERTLPPLLLSVRCLVPAPGKSNRPIITFSTGSDFTFKNNGLHTYTIIQKFSELSELKKIVYFKRLWSGDIAQQHQWLLGKHRVLSSILSMPLTYIKLKKLFGLFRLVILVMLTWVVLDSVISSRPSGVQSSIYHCYLANLLCNQNF